MTALTVAAFASFPIQLRNGSRVRALAGRTASKGLFNTEPAPFPASARDSMLTLTELPVRTARIDAVAKLIPDRSMTVADTAGDLPIPIALMLSFDS